MSLASLLLTTALRAEELSADASRRPNFIVILCDNLGYGDIEPFGSQMIRTPELNRMAREGRLLRHFYVTAGVCTPSRASFMTGCYAQRIGLHDNPRDGQVLRPLSPYGLNPAETTLAELLRDAGYRTALIGKWHLGDQPAFLPTRHGFDEFWGIPYSDDMTQEVGERLAESGRDRYDGSRWPPLPLMHNERVVEAPVDRRRLTQRYTERAVEFVRESATRPFFLFLSHAMPGSTRQPFASEAFQGKSAGGAWGDSVEEIDWSTGRLLETLRELGIERETLVLWTSDNGAPMAAAGESLHRGSNAPLYGRGYTTSEGAFRMPTLVWWPGRVPAGSVSDALCSSLDLLPTLAALAGAGGEHPVDGFDVQDIWTGEGESPYEAFFYYERDQLQAVRSGRWKLFVPLKEFDRHPHFRSRPHPTPILFDVVADPGCEHDRAAERPEEVEHLLALAESARHDLGDRGALGRGQRSPGRIDGQPSARRLSAAR